MKKRVCIIDNYDSFTYNIVHQLERLNSEVIVLKNNCQISKIIKVKPDKIILSPGPGSPMESGICFEVIKQFAGKVDILGVCLGHQIIAEYFGAKVSHAKKIMHGKISLICHNNESIFSNVKQEFKAARYHSLSIKPDTINQELKILATDKNDNEIMAIKHSELNIYGIQFHPESFLSECGDILISNFLESVDNSR